MNNIKSIKLKLQTNEIVILEGESIIRFMNHIKINGASGRLEIRCGESLKVIHCDKIVYEVHYYQD